MAVAWDYWLPRAWDLGEQQWSLAGAATWTTTSFPGDFDLGGTGCFQPWLLWRPFVSKWRYAGHSHKTSAKGSIFRETSTLAKELRKICERPVRVDCRTIYHNTSDRISHSQKTWPLRDCERFAKDLRKGSFLEPLFSPTLPYSCIDRTGSTDQLASRNFVRRSSKGKVLNLYDFLLANILIYWRSWQNMKLRSNSAWFSLRNVDRILNGMIFGRKRALGILQSVLWPGGESWKGIVWLIAVAVCIIFIQFWLYQEVDSQDEKLHQDLI